MLVFYGLKKKKKKGEIKKERKKENWDVERNRLHPLSFFSRFINERGKKKISLMGMNDEGLTIEIRSNAVIDAIQVRPLGDSPELEDIENS